MKFVYLGRTGLKVSELCLGTMTFGRETDENTARTMMDYFVEVGGNFFDTANVYSNGASEEILGRWQKEHGERENLVLATKVHFPMGKGPNDLGLSRKHIMSQVERSLERLQTDYVDLYQMHCWDPGTPLEETLLTLNDLVRTGKVRYIGASNFAGWQLTKALTTSKANHWGQFACVQMQYNLLERYIEWEMLPVCRDSGVGLLAWSPLGGGWLTGKYRLEGGRPNGDSRVANAQPWQEEFWEKRDKEKTWVIVNTVLDIATRRRVPPAQVALNWLRAQPCITAPIIGARTLEQLDENLKCLNWELDAEEKPRLDQMSEPSFPYPYRYIRDFARESANHH